MEYLLLDVADGIATLRLNRPSALNALNRALIGELEGAIDRLWADPDVRAVLLTGVGEKAFAAGADVTEFTTLNPEQTLTMSRAGQATFARLEGMNKPVLAAINGFALGGGLELALACHLRLAADSAKIGLPEVKLGLIPGYGGTQRLTRMVGPAKSTELILTGEPIDAATAHQLGIVNAVHPAGELIERATALLKLMTRHSREAVAAALQAIRASLSAQGDDGYRAETRLFADLMAGPNGREGVAAFLEKRKASWK